MSSHSRSNSPNPYDSPSHDRNPSPPPEVPQISELISAESIGNTAFSKHWLFSTLMKLIEAVDKENEEGMDRDLVVDVDDELQNELCKLWDMSMNQEVAVFLNEFKAIEILSGIIEKSKAPRVTEICVGILGNMACEPSVCKTMAENGKFVKLVLDMLETRDSPTLVEDTRLLSTCLANGESRRTWVRAIQRSEEVLPHLMFIFNSSTNTDLLTNTAELVATILDLETDLCVSWATTDFLESLLEATNQIGSTHTEAMEVYLQIFQNFSTTESGVEVLVHHGPQLEKKILKYLDLVCEYEIVSVDRLEVPLASALSVLHILLTARPSIHLHHLCKDERLMRILLKILEPLYPLLQRYQEERAKAGNSVSRLDKLRDQEQSSGTGDRQEADSISKSELSGDQRGGASDGGGGAKGGVCAVGGEVCTDGGGDVVISDSVDDQAVSEGKMSIEDEEEFKHLMTLYEILAAFIKDYCSLLISTLKTSHNDNVEPKDSVVEKDGAEEIEAGDSDKAAAEEEEKSEEMADKDTTESRTEGKPHKEDPDCESILEYLDASCSRSRLNYLLLNLRETTGGTEMFEQLYEHSEKLSKSRLCRIMNDVLSGKIVNRADSSKEEVPVT